MKELQKNFYILFKLLKNILSIIISNFISKSFENYLNFLYNSLKVFGDNLIMNSFFIFKRVKN